jgi:hypothetical protein
MRVDEARRDQIASGVDHFVSGLGQVGRGANGLNAVTPDQNGRIAPFFGLCRVSVVESGNAAGIFDEQSGHK